MEFIEKYARADDDSNISSDETVDNSKVGDEIIDSIGDSFIQLSICDYPLIQNTIKPKKLPCRKILVSAFLMKSQILEVIILNFIICQNWIWQILKCWQKIRYFQNRSLHLPKKKQQTIHFTLQFCRVKNLSLLENVIL